MKITINSKHHHLSPTVFIDHDCCIAPAPRFWRATGARGGHSGAIVIMSRRVAYQDHVISHEPTEIHDVLRVWATNGDGDWATKGGGEEAGGNLRVQLSVHRS